MSHAVRSVKTRETNMTVGRPMPLILKFVIPLFIGNIFQQFYNMVDSVIVGRFVGKDALGAVGSTGTIMFLLIGFGMGLTAGFAVLPAQCYGAGDHDGVRRAVANGILLTGILSIFTTTVGIVFMHPLLTAMNTPASIYNDAYSYIICIVGGTVCLMYYNLFSALLRAVGNSRAPLVFLVISAILNIFLDLLFIVGLQMGTAGAAIATDIAQGVSAILSLTYILKKFPVLTPKKGEWRFRKAETRKQVGVGLPMGIQFAITASGTIIMQGAINLFGPDAISSFTAGSKVVNLLTQGFPSIGATMATFSAQNFGKGEIDRVRSGVRVAFVTVAIYSGIALLLSILLLRPALTLFFPAGTDIEALLPWASPYVYLSAAFYLPLGMIFIYRNTMQGCGYALFPTLGGLVEFLARIVCAAIAMATLSYPLAVFCDPAAWIAAGLFTFIAYHILMRRLLKKRALDMKN